MTSRPFGRAAATIAAVLACSLGVVAVPVASALPVPGRALAPEGFSDAVVVPPGARDSTGRIPVPLGGAAPTGTRGALRRAGVPGAWVGIHSVLVLRVDYLGDTLNPKDETDPYGGQPYTLQAIRTVLARAGQLLSGGDGSVEFRGLNNPAGDVSDWISVPGRIPAAGWDCDYPSIRYAAFAGAQAQGIDVTRYNHAVIVFSDGSAPCVWAGRGERPGSTTWINRLLGGAGDAATIAHELGHNLGVGHAASVECTTAFSTLVTLEPCSLADADEYGDPFDFMGGGKYPYGPMLPWFGTTITSSWHRSQLLQIPEAEQQVVTTSGTYELGDARVPGATRLLRIARGTGTSEQQELVIERRLPGTDLDRWATYDPPVPDGVLIRFAPSMTSPERSILLDMHPETPTHLDAPLSVGSTFDDPIAGITISLASLVGGKAQLQIGGTSLPSPTPAPTPTPVATPVATPTPTTTPTPRAPNVVARLVRPSAARKRVVARTGGVTISVPGAGRLTVKAGGRTIATARRSRVAFTLPKALRSTATITIRATGGTLAAPQTFTLRIRKRVAKLAAARVGVGE